MTLNQVEKNSHVMSLDIAKSFKPSQSDPSYEVIDRLDNIWGGYMVDFDGAYSENQDISKQELRRLTQILQLMEKNCAAVRVEFQRRLKECSPSLHHKGNT
jgi:hypothetical protein